jgi:hypothetical protein
MASGKKKAGINPLEKARVHAIDRYLKPFNPRSRARDKSPEPAHNVVGVSVAHKRKEGKRTGRRCIVLYVRDKFEPGRIYKKDMLPKRILGVPTDIVQVGVPRFTKTRPGDSIFADQSSALIAPGTFGALVQDGAGKLFILSNNHVLADENRNPPGTEILTGSGDEELLARLTTFVRLRPNGPPNPVDAAIARIVQGAAITAVLPASVGPLSSAAPIAGSDDMRVHKRGATTGVKRGEIVSTVAAFNVPYDDGQYYMLTEQLHIEDDGSAFCDHGDSGSLVVDRATGRATGLLTARMDGFSLACKIETVLSKLSKEHGSTLTLRLTP